MQSKKRQGNRGLIIAAIVGFILLVTSRQIITFIADWLFFQEVGYAAVFSKTFQAKLLTGLLFGAVAFVVFLINLTVARRQSFPLRGVNPLWQSVPQLQHLDLDRMMGWLAFGVSGFMFLLSFTVGMQYWEQALLFLNSVPAGLADPLFNKDISFYLFSFPFVNMLNTMVRSMLVFAALLVVVLYISRGGVVWLGKFLSVDPAVKRHLAILISLFLISLSFSFALDRYGLMTTEHGVLYGASYTDVHVRLLMLTVMAVLSLATAILLPFVAAKRSFVLPLIALAVLSGVYFLGLKVYPQTVQSFQVSPNESVLELPYIADHIKFTRYGYGLEHMELQPFAADKQLAFTDIRKNLSTIQNIRLWDEDPLLKTYSQLQQIRTYYHFSDVDNDRYTVNGKYLQTMLSPRELSYADLPNKSWINERLVFTHGFGLCHGARERHHPGRPAGVLYQGHPAGLERRAEGDPSRDLLRRKPQ